MRGGSPWHGHEAAQHAADLGVGLPVPQARRGCACAWVVNLQQQQQQRITPPPHGGEAAADEVAAALGHSRLEEGSVALHVRPQVVGADGARDAPCDGPHDPAAS